MLRPAGRLRNQSGAARAAGHTSAALRDVPVLALDGNAPTVPAPELAVRAPANAQPAPWRASLRDRGLVLASLAAGSFYLGWWLSPGHIGTPALFVMLAAAEGFNMAHLLGFWSAVWAARFDPPPRVRAWPTIDVFVTTLGEPVAVLARTVAAAVAMDGAHRTYVLDDGARVEVQSMARALGAGYVRRVSHRGAKAGNLNNALQATDGELVAIFDADHVPRRDFLSRIVGYFEDPGMGFVQTPQYYENGEANEVARGAYQQQAIFYGPICRGKNGLGAAFCCGTNAVFRRRALESAGGFDQRSIVEDFVTSMRIHRKGWRSVYYPYVLASGMGPSTLGDYFRQQFRWARGSVGALASLEPFKPGLRFAQRFQYLLATTFYLIGAVTMIYIALPIVFLLSGRSAFSVGSGSFVFFYAPYMILALLTIRRSLGGQLRLDHLRFTFGTFPVYALAGIAALLHVPARFKVTAKGAGGRVRLPALAAAPVIASLATVVAVAVGASTRPIDERTVTNMSWAGLNLLLLFGTVRIVGSEARRALQRAPEGRAAPERAGCRTLQAVSAPVAEPGADGAELVLPERALRSPLAREEAAAFGKPALAVGLLTAVGLALRAALIATQSLRLDEAASLRQARLPVTQMWRSLLTENVHVPLYHTVLHLWIRVAGTSEWAMRVPSVLFGVAAVPLLYLVGRRLVGRRAAVIASAIGAVAPFWVWHSDEARMYPMSLTISLGATVLLFRALERGGAGRWAAYSTAMLLGFYTHYFALMMVPIHLAYLVVDRAGRRRILAWLAAAGAAGAGFTPWVIWLWTERISRLGLGALTNGVRLPLIDYTIFGVVYGLLIFFAIYVIGYQAPGPIAVLSGVAVGLWPLAALRLVVGNRRDPATGRAVRFLLAWLALSVGLVFAVSLWRPGLLLQRYLTIASPAVFLLLALTVSRAVRRPAVAVAIVLASLGPVAVAQSFQISNPQREDFRGAAVIIDRGFRPGDAVLAVPEFVASPLEYYLSPDEEVVGILSTQESPDVAVSFDIPRIALAHPGGSLWVLIHAAYRDTFDPEVFAAVPRALDASYPRAGTWRLGQMEIRRYALPAG